MVGSLVLAAISTLQFARSPLPAVGTLEGRAESRTIYLNRDGAVLLPADTNDSSADLSSVITEPTVILGWDIDDATWAETFNCVRDLYAPFDVHITDDDPGDAPHIEAIVGGHPADVGLPDNVGGVSPFTTDCAVIERSVVFAFTDVMDDDPRTVCETIAQEVAHSFGLDHEMLPNDPMTYLFYNGPRSFQDEMATCGEFGDRMCGISGNICRERQNSYRLLGERLGFANAPEDTEPSVAEPLESVEVAGCSAGQGSSSPLLALLALLSFRSRTRTTSARARCPTNP